MEVIEFENKREIRAKLGFVLTDWDKDDILRYNSCKLVIMPLKSDYTRYYEITEDEHKDLENKRKIKQLELENERRKYK